MTINKALLATTVLTVLSGGSALGQAAQGAPLQLAQAAVPVVALLIWRSQAPAFWGHQGMAGAFVLNAFFVALWVGSALLFRRAAASAAGPTPSRRLE